MLSPVGKIAAILNEDMVLVQAEDLSATDVLVVFARIPASGIRLPEGSPGIDELDIPKGHLRVVLAQSGGYYTAERFRETNERTRVVRKGHSLAEAIMGRWGGPGEEFIETVPGEWSARLDPSDSSKIPVTRVVRVGDLVAKL